MCRRTRANIRQARIQARLSDPAALPSVLGTGLYLAVLGLLALGLGTLTRRTAACVRHNSGCLEAPAALERRSAGRHPLASVKLPRDANSAGLAGT